MSVKVGLVSLGCAKNLIDSEIMIGHLAKAGMTMTANAADADVVARIDALWIYPVKSCAGVALTEAEVTPTGLAWLAAFRKAVAQAEAEFRDAVGKDVATVVALGLEAYAH